MQHNEDYSDTLSVQSASTTDSRQPQKQESLINLVERVYQRQLVLNFKVLSIMKVLNLKESPDRS